jgi:hypothetical protein
VSVPTPAETRQACRRLLDPPPAALTIPVRVEPGLWERRDVAVPLLWDAFANLFVIGCFAGPVVLVGLALCAWLWRWSR